MLNLILLSIFLHFSTAGFAQNDPGTLDAEKDLVYYSADIINADLIMEKAKLTGNVKILFDQYELNASNAEIFKRETTLKAWGNVRLEGNNSYIEADRIELNYKTQKATITNVRLTSGQLLLEAKTVYKISDEVYEATNAKFTTCMTCPPGWRIKGKKIQTNINKYVEIKGGRFQILNQTLFPLPWLVLPLNTRRKTGLLSPELENSSGNSGLEFTVPYFLVIDPHRDFTFSPMIYFDDKNFNTTGAKLLTEYNQWLGSKSKLYLKTAFMYDDAHLDFNSNPNPGNRWFLHFTNYFVLPRNIIQKSNLTLLKERTYLSDFTSEVSGRGEPALKNTFSLSKAKGNRFLSAKAIYHINLLVEDPAARDNFSVQKLPEINYSISETPFLNNFLLFNSSATYTNFHRNSRSFDEINSNTGDPDLLKDIDVTGATGQFNTEEDLIRTGHRLRLNAEVSAPFRIGDSFDVRPALSYKDSYYRFNVDKKLTINNNSSTPYAPFAYSRYVEFSNSIRTEFSKVYGGEVKHKIVPEIIFRYGSSVEHSGNIFFNGTAAGKNLPYHRQYQPITDENFYEDGHNVQFDYWDRFFRANVVEFSISNMLIKKHRQELVTYYDQPFFFSLTQSYDFKNKNEAAIPDPWSNLNSLLKFKSKNFINHTQASYFYKAKQTNITTSNKFIYKPGRYIKVDYSDFLTVDYTGALTDNRTQNIRFGLGWEFETLKVSGWTNYSILQKDHLGWGSNLSYTPRGNCWGIGVRLWKLNNTNKINSKFNFRLNFGPDPRSRKSLLTI